MEEKTFEKMVFDFRQRISELQAPAVRSLSPEDFEALRRDKELRSKSANYRLIKEKLAQAPTGQQEIFSTIRNTPESKLHLEALRIYSIGLEEFQKILEQIEQSETELKNLHYALAKNAKARSGLEGRKVNLYLKMKEMQKCLPASEHKIEFPPRAPEWSHFLPDEDRIGKAYGHKPILFRD
jgi:hypothetical protein